MLIWSHYSYGYLPLKLEEEKSHLEKWQSKYKGKPCGGDWEPMLVMERTASKDDFMASDIVSEKAKQVLEPYLQNQVEFLPLVCPDGKYFYMHPTLTIGGVGRDKEGTIIFDEALLENIYIFRADKSSTYDPDQQFVYVTSAFADLLLKYSLTNDLRLAKSDALYDGEIYHTRNNAKLSETVQVWEFEADTEKYKTFYSIEDEEKEERFDEEIGEKYLEKGISIASHWQTIEVSKSKTKKNSPDPDIAWFWGGLVVNQRAKALLEPVLGNAVEFLPLSCGEEQVFLIHALKVIDCLNYELTEYKILYDDEVENDDDEKKMNFARKITYVDFDSRDFFLNEEKLQEEFIFRIPYNTNHMFITNKLKTFCEKNKITGIDFDKDNFIKVIQNN